MNAPPRLYVGNLPWDATSDLVADMFNLGTHEAKKVLMVTDRETGSFRGFAFVTMSNDIAAKIAIALFDGFPIAGRPMRVRIAEDRRP